MLGYTKEDLDKMINASVYVSRRRVLDREDYAESVNKALDFLEGLWAEGYFD